MSLSRVPRRGRPGVPSMVPAAACVALLALTPAPSDAARVSAPTENPAGEPTTHGTWRRLDPAVAWGEPGAAVLYEGTRLDVVPRTWGRIKDACRR